MTTFNQTAFIADMNFKLKQERYSLRDAAEEIGVSASTLSRISNGKAPDLSTYGKICHWLEEATDKYFFEIPEDMDDVPPEPTYSALDDADVSMLRDYAVREDEIAGVNRYVQTILDERDECYTALKVAFDLLEEHLPAWYLRKHYNIIAPCLGAEDKS